MNYWNKIYKLALILMGILMLIAVAGVFIPQCRRLLNLQDTKTELAQDNRNLEESISDLKGNQENFTTNPDFVVKTAREAGMVKPNEVVFKFTNNEAKVSSSHKP